MTWGIKIAKFLVEMELFPHMELFPKKHKKQKQKKNTIKTTIKLLIKDRIKMSKKSKPKLALI